MPTSTILFTLLCSPLLLAGITQAFPFYLASAITFSSLRRATLTVSFDDPLGPHQSIELCVLRESPKVNKFFLNHSFVPIILVKNPQTPAPGVTHSFWKVHAREFLQLFQGVTSSLPYQAQHIPNWVMWRFNPRLSPAARRGGSCSWGEHELPSRWKFFRQEQWLLPPSKGGPPRQAPRLQVSGFPNQGPDFRDLLCLSV